MTQRWEVGVRAAIVISEHYENHNRVVTLVEKLEYTDNYRGWGVKDGKQFKGYDPSQFPERVFMWSDTLGIEQWKLRLLDADEPVVIRDGVEYVAA